MSIVYVMAITAVWVCVMLANLHVQKRVREISYIAATTAKRIVYIIAGLTVATGASASAVITKIQALHIAQGTLM